MPKVLNKWQCRIAPSLGGGFAGTPNEVWGTKDYKNDTDPTVFFGLYGLPDFYTLWAHKGKKAILWCGSDITHFINGYWLDKQGSIKLSPTALGRWINDMCESWVENEIEANALEKLGIKARICPSFLGNIEDYEISFKPGNKVYTSVSGDDFKLYGWHLIDELAERNPKIDFNLYGNIKYWKTKKPNVILHGRVSQEVMNEEIKQMQGALRLTEFDGCSELIVKAILWGQYAFSLIEYPGVHDVESLRLLNDFVSPNEVGRDWWIKNLNKYPWNLRLQ